MRFAQRSCWRPTATVKKVKVLLRTLVNTRQIEMAFYSSTDHKSQNNGFYDRKFRDPRLEI